MDEDVSNEQPSSWDQQPDQSAGAGTDTAEPQPVDPYQGPSSSGAYGHDAQQIDPYQDPGGAGASAQEAEPSYAYPEQTEAVPYPDQRAPIDPYQDAGAATYAEPQPVDPYAPGSPTEADLVVGLGELILHQEATQGTTYLLVTAPVINWNSRPTTDGELTLSITARPYNVDTGADSGSAERMADVNEPVPAMASGQTHHIQVPLQLDAGSYHVNAELSFASHGPVLHTSGGDVTVHGGHASHAIAYDENVRFDITVQVTGLTRLRESLYQVHYTLTNTSPHAVPAGLTVYGGLQSDATGMFSQQMYQLPAKLEPHHPASSYLTLEGADTGWLTATIETDPNGPSHELATLQVEAETVQAHASSSSAAHHPSQAATPVHPASVSPSAPAPGGVAPLPQHTPPASHTNSGAVEAHASHPLDRDTLRNGIIQAADDRLRDLCLHMLNSAIAFRGFTYEMTEGIHAPKSSSTGIVEDFVKAVVAVASAINIESTVVREIVKQAFTLALDLMKEAPSSPEGVERAKDDLRHLGNAMADGFSEAINNMDDAERGFRVRATNLLNDYLMVYPHALENLDGTTETFEQLATQWMQLPTRGVDPSYHLFERLKHEFTTAVTRVGARIEWDGQNKFQRAVHLASLPKDDRRKYLELMGENPQAWLLENDEVTPWALTP